MSNRYDVIIVGGGPAGAVCGAHCATAGLRTLILERAIFPREKVCGDCINPGCWPIFERLDLSERVRALPHAALHEVEFRAPRSGALRLQLETGAQQEVAIKRSLLDTLLLQRAEELGAEVRQNTAVVQVEPGWHVWTEEAVYEAEFLVAADGRNSTVARLRGLLPKTRKDRVAQQTHFPLPASLAGRVVMQFLPLGYAGRADVGEGEANLCLVAKPEHLGPLRAWAQTEFDLPADQAWRTIAPLQRRPARHDQNLLLVGDAARVVEPFTGEGIYYALASGELAADALRLKSGSYARRHAALYRGRLWINELARLACLYPILADLLIALGRIYPATLARLTSKVTGGAVNAVSGVPASTGS